MTVRFDATTAGGDLTSCCRLTGRVTCARDYTNWQQTEWRCPHTTAKGWSGGGSGDGVEKAERLLRPPEGEAGRSSGKRMVQFLQLNRTIPISTRIVLIGPLCEEVTIECGENELCSVLCAEETSFDLCC